MNTGLADLLERIEIPHQSMDGSRYHVTPIPGLDAHYLGRTGDGAPCLLISSKDGGMKSPLRLAGIEAYFSLQCNIALEDGAEKVETLTVITCTAKEPSLQAYFTYICEVLLKIVGPTPTLQQVADAVWRLVELFQKLARPLSKPIVGLWGELYAIHRSRNPRLALQAWRSEVDDRFDFSMDKLRFEVKSTSTRTRAHEFSFEQCNPPDETTGVLVSLTVEARRLFKDFAGL
ncbi:MAG: hypothetical protein CMM94_07020 [Rickettsiales bacterium]|nr:hypothetical protein [Rickettsiales bacterium]